MAVRSILRMGDPRLLTVAAEVSEFGTPALRALVDDLFETMRATDGVGLAAPQIGVGLRIVVFGCESNLRYPLAPAIPDTVLINPQIEALDDEETFAWEGCLSLPGLRGEVPRWRRIRYRGCDEDGNLCERVVEDFHARVVQHECDHLSGHLYPMRMRDLSRFGFIEELQASNP